MALVAENLFGLDHGGRQFFFEDFVEGVAVRQSGAQ